MSLSSDSSKADRQGKPFRAPVCFYKNIDIWGQSNNTLLQEEVMRYTPCSIIRPTPTANAVM